MRFYRSYLSSISASDKIYSAEALTALASEKLTLSLHVSVALICVYGPEPEIVINYSPLNLRPCAFHFGSIDSIITKRGFDVNCRCM